MAPRFIECCCTSVYEVLQAQAGGASRIELCADLPIGGVTPPAQLLREVLDSCTLPVNVLVRPRGGDFCYSEAEVDQMLQSIADCKRLGANGVVIGALTTQGDVDVPLMRRLIAAARPLSVTFHRAFDECRDPMGAFRDIVGLGCDRLLSSGHEPSAYQGRALLRRLIETASPIVVMPGAGINPSNIKELDHATGATEFHGSAHGPSGLTDSAVVAALVNN